MFRPFIPLLAFALVGVSGWAQTEPDPEVTAPPAARPFFSRVSGLFSGDLPQLDSPGAVKLILRAHFGDLVRRDYLRVDTGLRWALDEDFEVSGEADTFFTHGLRGSAGYGIGKFRFGSKYVFERWPNPDYETSLGLNLDLPVGHPPLDMTDGHNHFTPTVVVQHFWTSVPRLTTFAGLGVDVVSDSSARGIWGTNQPHDDTLSFTTGGVYDAGQLKWTLTGIYATSALITDHPTPYYLLQPGLLWYVPKKLTFHSKTQWIVGLNANASWGPDGFDLSLGSRVRAEITFRQVMDKLRASTRH
jgi:hypothetical protein